MRRPSHSSSSLSRRDMLKLAAAGFSAYSASGWIENIAARAALDQGRKRACILLWMSGGPSQTDTFDTKPGHANGGTFKTIETAVPGITVGEHLPKVAKEMKEMAVLRSMSTKEGDHGRATYYLRTGYAPSSAIQFPTMGSVLSKELEEPSTDLPSYVCVAPFKFLSPGAFGAGFLGPQHGPLVVGEQRFGAATGNAIDQALKVPDLDLPKGVNLRRSDARLGLLEGVENEFSTNRPGGSPLAHRTAYERAVRMMRSPAARAFNLDEEPKTLRDAYGRNLFGQGCLLARRLIERGVPFVEVTLSGVDNNVGIGWDTHAQNFDQVKKLCNVLDPAWATLVQDLRAHGLLDSTLIVWMGEFGRTPQINPQGGRDHFPNAWTTVLAGGGIKGGQAYGKTTADGVMVADSPVSVPDFMATVSKALGIDPMKQNMSEVGRPIRIADPEARAVKEVLA